MSPEPGPFGAADAHRACCAVARAREEGCSLGLPRDKGAFVCISGTEYQRNHGFTARLSDVLLIWAQRTRTVAAVVELKGRNPSAIRVQAQLQHGAGIVESLLTEVGVSNFAPAVLHRGISGPGIRAFSMQSVRFRGRLHPIRLKRCGTSAAELFA